VSYLIVFDLDGTLVDSRRDLADSTNDVLASYGAGPLGVDAVSRMVGDGAKMLVARALKAANVDVDLHDALDRFREIYDRRLLVHTRPYSGIVDLVRVLPGRAALAVLSNKPAAPTERLLEAFDIRSCFGGVVGGDSAFARKPDPAGLRSLIAGAGVTARETLMVGDSMIDLETARRAGAQACFARYGFGHLRGGVALEPGERDVASVAELGRAIEEFLVHR
jgi:phosphoglycolate phosphatase